MTLIGTNGVAAPRLKDCTFHGENSDLEWELLYQNSCEILRDLFQNCKLVHGDLSEYNLLFFANEVYVIDVSQAVEMDHPHALDFLKRDCQNINAFFARKGVDVLSLRGLYEFVVRAKRVEVEELIEEGLGGDEEDNVEAEIFKNAWKPTSLHQISDFSAMDKELDKIMCGEDALCADLLAPSSAALSRVEEEDEDAFFMRGRSGSRGSSLCGTAGSRCGSRGSSRGRRGYEKSEKTVAREQARADKALKHAAQWRRYREKKRLGAKKKAGDAGRGASPGESSYADSAVTLSLDLDGSVVRGTSGTGSMTGGDSPVSDHRAASPPRGELPQERGEADREAAACPEVEKAVAQGLEEHDEQSGSDSDSDSDAEGDVLAGPEGPENTLTDHDDPSASKKKLLPPKEKKLPEGSRDPNMSKEEWKTLVKKQKAEKRAEKMPKSQKKKHKNKK